MTGDRARASRSLAALCGLLVSSLALAQVPVPAPAVAAPDGLKVGEGRLHATFAVESRLDSAAGYFLSAKSGPRGPNPEVLWLARPGVRYELPGRDLDVRASAGLEYLWYTAWLTPGSGHASRLQGSADLAVNLNRGGPFEVRITDTFARTDRATNVAAGFGVLTLRNTFAVAVPFRPGAGALELTPDASYGLETFSPIGASVAPGCTDISCDPQQVSALDSQTVHGGVEARWRFLPRTALVLDTDFQHRAFMRGTVPGTSVLKVTTGLSGLLSARVAVNLRAGWAQDVGASRTGAFVAQAEASAPIYSTATVRAGYQRALESAGTLGLYTDDRLYLEGRWLLAGRLTLVATGALDWVGFRLLQQRRDRIAQLELTPDYRVSPWLQVGAGYVLGTRASSAATQGGFNSLSYSRHEGFVRVTATY